MRITDIRLRQLTGHMPVDGPFFEERLLQPTDIYDEFRSAGDIHPRGQLLDDSTFDGLVRECGEDVMAGRNGA